MARRIIGFGIGGAGALGLVIACSSGDGPEQVRQQRAALTSPLSNMRSHIGTFKDGAWALDVNGNGVWDGCTTDRCLSFGSPGDIPITGDWNGDGVVSIGTYRPSTNSFLLDWNHNGYWDGAPFDKQYTGFVGSNAQNKPVAGTWSVGARSTIGMFRDGQWFLDKNGDGVYTASDLRGTFGGAGDLPVVGRWGGGGTDLLGVFRPSGNQWFLDADGSLTWSACPPDVCSGTFGAVTDLPVAGVWRNGNVASVGTYRDGAWFLDGNVNRTWDNCTSDDCVTSFGSPGDSPVVGEWPNIHWGRGADVNVGNLGSMWENSAAVVASHPSCTQGRAILSIGESPRAVYRTDLSCVQGGTCSGLTDTLLSSSLSGTEGMGTDNQTVRVGTDLYQFRLITQDGTGPNKRRVSAAISKSSNCGSSWSRWSTIDSGTILNGDCSLMQGQTTAAYYHPANHTLYIDNGDFKWDLTVQTGGRNGGYDQAVDLTAVGTNFGMLAGDVLVAGNWNQISVDKGGPGTALGRFRNGAWLLDTNRNFNDDGCSTDRCFTFGQAGDIPIVGRFKSGGDNDVRSQVGVFRPSTGTWILDSNYNYTEDATDTRFSGFGMAGDVPIVGDWTGTGPRGQLMRAGVFRPSTGGWFLDGGGNGWNGCGTDTCFLGTFGDSSQVPISGVWKAAPNFRDSIGTYAAGMWNLDVNGNGVWDGASESFGPFGNAGDVPLPGFWSTYPGGWDRIEAYADPYNGMMYATMGCDARDQKQLFSYSNDGGQTWAAQVVEPTNVRPMMITSTQNRTYLFSTWGYNPVLWPITIKNDLGSPLSVSIGPRWVVYQNHGAFAVNEPAGASGYDDRAYFANSAIQDGRAFDGSEGIATIGRSGTTDSLLATYHSVLPTPDHEVTRLMRINVSGTTSLSVSTVSLGNLEGRSYSAPSRYGHVTQATLVPGEQGSEYSLVYWKEVDLGLVGLPGGVTMRAAVLRVPYAGTASKSILDLSTDASGKTRSWSGYHITGDYQKGAAFTSGGLQQFLTQWVETPDGGSRSLHAEVVTVHP